ncbi:UNKNOWN [Stylonychia lemnae]|uniref:Methyltransferase domain-containing protein n=1 Tax=Stylonychia lemnae TaxID=5949 RepID=A0A078B5L8_STYLE|nr:UNKNOWN [Stylonychia lemnae]|eukprot:CDW89709.1 UNKNOWN [Stylonychia lemnae]
MIIVLELFLQFGLLLVLLGLCLWLGDKVFLVVEHLIYHLIYQSTWPRKLIWKFFYNSFSWYLKNENYFRSHNCGYAILTQTGETLKLVAKQDIKNQYQNQMYHYAALGIRNLDDLQGKNVLDLATGRGGGLAFLAKYFYPKNAVGIDISSHQIQFAQSHQDEIDSLSYFQGDVECLNAVNFDKDIQYDLITCIESLHCFSNLSAIFNGVQNLMQKNGNFVIVDIFEKKEVKNIEKIMKHFFMIEKREIITINVKHAMNLDKPRVEKMISKFITDNEIAKQVMRNILASAEGSKTYEELGKTKEYICYVLRHPNPAIDATHQCQSPNEKNMRRYQEQMALHSYQNDPQNQQQSM